ncbi:MAG TPA: multicopper oxidase family protein [Solirubrobacterales bacterium]|nr:multicopper oxidase family protein [Solirubrobacterales bacterium]
MASGEQTNETKLSRRSLIAAAGAAGVALALPASNRWRGGLGSASAAPVRVKPFARELPIPPVLTGSEITVRMRAAEVRVLPGRRTRMWTYNGRFPGPTIRRPAGERTRVRFIHELPPNAGEMTVHLHGGHNSSADDGQPGGLTASQPRALYCDISGGLSAAESGNELLIPPGGARTYTYDLVEDGAPERAAFQWYHDHRLERTARNVWRGLAGMWIIDDELDASLPLPRGRRDIPLMLADRSFNRRNQLTDPFAAERRPPDDGVTGRHVLVNGAILPTHRVSGQRHRLRILNASSFRSYNLTLTNDVPIVQIATEAGLTPKPLARRRVLVGPGERVELIADFSRARGRRVRLVSRRRRGPDKLGSRAYEGALMEFRVADRRRADATSIPATLRPLPDWVASASPEPTHEWRITVGTGLRPRWLINGRTFDPSYADATGELGSVATWALENRTAVAHLMHLHHTDWYVLSRNGRPPPPWERCLKETFFLDPGDRVVVAGKLSDHAGKYVVHCHMLDHEDHGLMSQFEVVDPGG